MGEHEAWLVESGVNEQANLNDAGLRDLAGVLDDFEKEAVSNGDEFHIQIMRCLAGRISDVMRQAAARIAELEAVVEKIIDECKASRFSDENEGDYGERIEWIHSLAAEAAQEARNA